MWHALKCASPATGLGRLARRWCAGAAPRAPSAPSSGGGCSRPLHPQCEAPPQGAGLHLVLRGPLHDIWPRHTGTGDEKGHPGGAPRGLGISPSRTIQSQLARRCGSSSEMADIRASVYGYHGLPNSSLVRATSTSLPRYITATRSVPWPQDSPPRRLFPSSGPPGRRSDTPAQEAGERDPPVADSTAAQQPGSRPRPIRPPHGPANGTRPAGPLPPATEGRVPPSGRHLPRTNSGDGRDNRTEGCAGSESHRSR